MLTTETYLINGRAAHSIIVDTVLDIHYVEGIPHKQKRGQGS